MEMLAIEGTKSTPEILFDPATGVLSMSGESYPENSFEFYRPILSWLARFSAVHHGPLTFNTNLSYLNTGSTKCMMDILDLLEESHLNGKTVAVNWYYDEENHRAFETAEEFKEEVSVPFNIIPVSEQP
ncbi:MAG: biofilm regulation phosphoprotein SiaC [Geobacteraceae bacterium]|nr:biofilm regulation phosphoprotein SiaC [Geobacteraceae bacterium]